MTVYSYMRTWLILTELGLLWIMRPIKERKP